jgi:hypothetical protein
MPGSSVSRPVIFHGIEIPDGIFQWISVRCGGMKVLNMALPVQFSRQGKEATG